MSDRQDTTPSANPQTCSLTYNIVATTAYGADASETMSIQFTLNNQVIWATKVNQDGETSTTNQDQTFGSVAIKAGSSVTMNLYGPTAYVNFSGQLTDGKGDTTINNAQLAMFTLTPNKK